MKANIDKYQAVHQNINAYYYNKFIMNNGFYYLSFVIFRKQNILNRLMSPQKQYFNEYNKIGLIVEVKFENNWKILKLISCKLSIHLLKEEYSKHKKNTNRKD